MSALTDKALKCFNPKVKSYGIDKLGLIDFLHGAGTPTSEFLKATWQAKWNDQFLNEDKIALWVSATLNNKGGVFISKEDLLFFDKALLYGWCGLPGGITLNHLLFKHGTRDSRPPLNETMIVINILKYHAKHGHLPPTNADEVEGLPGETWARWDEALRSGCRGFEAGSSLHKLFVKYGFILGDLSKDLIADQAFKVYKKTGKLPGVHYGDMPDYKDETFGGANQALIKGSRGLEGGSSLNELYIERGWRVGQFSEKLIFKEMLYHVRDHNRIPNKYCAQFGNYIDETWNKVAQIAEAGKRGLTRAIKLDVLFREHLDKQAFKHFIRTGLMPTYDSGALPDYPEITWKMVDDAYRNRGRGHSTTLEEVLKPLFERLRDMHDLLRANSILENQNHQRVPLAAFMGPPKPYDLEP